MGTVSVRRRRRRRRTDGDEGPSRVPISSTTRVPIADRLLLRVAPGAATAAAVRAAGGVLASGGSVRGSARKASSSMIVRHR